MQLDYDTIYRLFFALFAIDLSLMLYLIAKEIKKKQLGKQESEQAKKTVEQIFKRLEQNQGRKLTDMLASFDPNLTLEINPKIYVKKRKHSKVYQL